MGKTYKISEEQMAELVAARKKNRDKAVDKRLEALILRGQGMKNKEAAAKVGKDYRLVSRWMSAYSNQGFEAITGNHYAGNRRNMTFEEEAEFLAPWLEKAKAGQVVDAVEIGLAYQAKVGHKIGAGQIYLVLARHGWRKVMPRSKHPKAASEAEREASKKLNPQ